MMLKRESSIFDSAGEISHKTLGIRGTGQRGPQAMELNEDLEQSEQIIKDLKQQLEDLKERGAPSREKSAIHNRISAQQSRVDIRKKENQMEQGYKAFCKLV